MERKQYLMTGWLSIAMAVIVVPLVALGLFLDYIARTYPIVNIFHVILSVIFCFLGVYILYVFRKLLNMRYQFYLVDTLIFILICYNIIMTIFGFFRYFVPDSRSIEITISIIGFVLFYSFGIFNILFGVKLLKLKNDVFGLLKPYAYTTMISGICILAILLLPFGLLAAVAAYIIQGIIFLRAADDVEFV